MEKLVLHLCQHLKAVKDEIGVLTRRVRYISFIRHLHAIEACVTALAAI